MQLTKRHFVLASKWMPSAMTYGAAATLAVLYFTDWKYVLRHVPIYGSKFEQ
ncbi:hypothetical protein DMN91_010577 [Ooceraea biroi]|uniref:Cytochrome b-c1 complex subunit 10 n=1 Tax=Ooceraea biroi TaxID=2015173 RepID=A0A026WW87_OOCBI|nr:cytochrome b-c1 complex subunit 10 [Ooceraea biroi]EZA60292.1 hypothetical protein X777_13381 [Ooceraea biroi]RLU16509.1 hypothetical protein DMN91_010577 [Ooceraea biroi]